MNEIKELEKVSEIADARLDVAENFAWVVAALSALFVQVKWDSWLLAVGASVLGFILSIYPFRKQSDAAEDAFMKASKTGRYYEEPLNETDDH